jgi:4-amino-4-deoxy-L-arabinose transferase-like glycosyltransferase
MAGSRRGWTPREVRWLAAVTLAALVLFTYGLGVGTLWDQDEPKYLQVAREITETKDPFTLRLDGEPWFVHPPLFMWLEAATGSLFGFSEFTARVWSAISGAAIVAVTFLLGRLLYDGKTGLIAAALTATTLQVLGQARLAVFDPTLLAFMLAALYMALVAYQTHSRRAQLWAWMWAGWATATKGPIGLIFPAALIVGLVAVRRDWSRWRDLSLWGPVIYAAIGLPWYLVETLRHGEPFVRQAIGYYLFNRFFGVVENQPGPWWYYAPVLLLGAFPWTAVAPPALALALRQRSTLPGQVILLWCGLVVLFYSLAGTKLPNYVLPVYPVLAVGIAHFGSAVLDGDPDARRLLRWAAVGLPLLSGLIVAALVVYGRTKYPAEARALLAPLVVIAALFAAGPMVAFGFLVARRPAAALIALGATMVVAVPVLVHSTLPAIERFRPIPRIARRLAAQMQPADALIAVGMSVHSSLRYYSGHRVIWVETPAELDRAVCQPGRAFIVVPADLDAAWVARDLPTGVRLQGEDAGYRIHVKDGSVTCGSTG